MHQLAPSTAVRVDHRGALGAERVHQRIQHRLHHARRQHLLAHAPQDMVEHLAAAQRGRDAAGECRRTRSSRCPCRGCRRCGPRRRAAGRRRRRAGRALPSARFSQARRRRTGAVTRNGLKPLAVPLASSSSAGWPIRVAAGQPSAGSGVTNDEAAPARRFRRRCRRAIVTRSRQRCRLSSRASRSVGARLGRGAWNVAIASFMAPEPCVGPRI